MSLRRLHRIIEDYMLDLSRDPTLETIALDASFDIEDHYRREGYADASVTYEITRDEQARLVEVVFTVTEGPLVTASMLITGNDAFDDERLLRFWDRRSTGTFGLDDPVFVEAEVPALTGTLRTFYRAQGYRDVEVSTPQIDRPAGAEHAEVAIALTEGPVYHLGTITIGDALAAALGAELVAEIAGRAGATASGLAIEQIRNDVVAHLRGNGYPSPVVKVETTENRPDREVDVSVSGEPGDRGRIVAVEIRGNEQTLDWFIRSHYAFEIGDWYDGQAIDTTRRELYLSGLFQKVDIDHEWAGPDELEVTITVEETESKTVDVLGGYGSYERFRGMVRFEEANVFGTGRRLSIEGRGSTKGYRGAVTLTDPRFLNTRTTLTVSGDVFEREEPAFTDRSRGVTTALSRNLGLGLRARTGYSYRLRRVAEEDLTADVPESFVQGNLFGELELDRRDSLLYPRSGLLVAAKVDADDPAFGSDISFQRLRVNASFFVPIYREVNLALRASTGLLWPGGGFATVPIQERFFNGGENTVRSFREAQLGPVDAEGRPVGGEFRNIFTVELRSPLVGLLEGALFADAGNIGLQVDDYGLDDMRYGIGAGLRLKLPIGPVRVDAAHNPDRRPGEDEWVVHLSVGYPF